MRLTLRRIALKDTYTIGKLYVDGVYFCDTLEDKDRGLKKTWELSRIKAAKVYGQTAIPKGTYAVNVTTISPKFANRSWAKQYGGIVPRILAVPGFDGVLIHPGNVAADTLGCVLVGRNTEVGKVTSSQSTWAKLMDAHLLPAEKKGDSIFITIQ